MFFMQSFNCLIKVDKTKMLFSNHSTASLRQPLSIQRECMNPARFRQEGVERRSVFKTFIELVFMQISRIRDGVSELQKLPFQSRQTNAYAKCRRLMQITMEKCKNLITPPAPVGQLSSSTPPTLKRSLDMQTPPPTGSNPIISG